MANLLKEICDGYSRFVLNYREIFFKHPSILQDDLEEVYNRKIEEFQKEGLWTESEALSCLHEQGVWTQGDEENYQRRLRKIRYEKEVISKIKNPLTRKNQEKQLEKEIKTWEELFKERYCVLSKTAERAADEWIEAEHISSSLFQDKGLTVQLEWFDSEVMEKVKEIWRRLSIEEIRKICSTYEFQDIFLTGSESAQQFFGKASIQLTKYQSLLFSQGKYFHGIFTSMNVPEDVQGDPEKIISFAKAQREKMDRGTPDKTRNQMEASGKKSLKGKDLARIETR